MIGVLGGTFDPVHFGHLRCALELQQSFDLAQVRFLPCREPPHRDAPFASPEQRLEMLELAIDDQPGFRTDDRELRRPGPSYMVDTLESIRAESGNTPVCLIVGMDAFLQLHTWHDWERLIGLAHIIAMRRPGREISAAPAPMRELLNDHVADEPRLLRQSAAGRIVLWTVTQIEISGTRIRDLIARGRSVRYLLPERVIDYILQERLYLGMPTAGIGIA